MELGIRIADTAPAYGDSELFLGKYWTGAIWTKTGTEDLEHSLERLQRNQVDLLQWHNWCADDCRSPILQEWLAVSAEDARIGEVGVTVYNSADALAGIEIDGVGLVQCPWNVCDVGTARAISAKAKSLDKRIAGRSVYLQGLLAGRKVPPEVTAGYATLTAFKQLACEVGCQSSVLALRAALECTHIDFVLVGLDHPDQLNPVREALQRPPLDDAIKNALTKFDANGAAWTDPRNWS